MKNTLSATNTKHIVAAGLFVCFTILYMLDAWLSLKFIAIDPLLEANTLIITLIEKAGTPNALYWLKGTVACFAGYIFYKYEKLYPGRTIILSMVLIALMALVNTASIVMLYELYSA